MHACMHAYMRAWMYVCMYACIYVRMGFSGFSGLEIQNLVFCTLYYDKRMEA